MFPPFNIIYLFIFFFQALYEFSIERYNEVNVGTLDVGVHPHWAKMFVPKETKGKKFNAFVVIGKSI